MYESVDWSVIEKLHIGMMTTEVDQLFHILSFNNLGNGFVYSTLNGKQYEIAMRLSPDGQNVQDISCKEIELSETAKETILRVIKVSNEPGITRDEARKIQTDKEILQNQRVDLTR